MLLDPAKFEFEVDDVAFETLNALQLLRFHTTEQSLAVYRELARVDVRTNIKWQCRSFQCDKMVIRSYRSFSSVEPI